MKRATHLFLSIVILLSCGKSDNQIYPPDTINAGDFIAAADISAYPEIELSNPAFYNADNQKEDLLSILKRNGVNTIRLRLWVNPSTGHSGFDEVSAFSKRLKKLGFKIWLTVHYSDTWADPGNQEMPLQWQAADFMELKDSVEKYTQKIAMQLKPELIQIGNEINSGFLHPEGKLDTNPLQFGELMSVAIASVREYSPASKIIIHFAGINNSTWFYEQMVNLDYDIIGLSYYPIWHGKNLNELKIKMEYLSQTFNKEIVIAETAYPFTLTWYDWTNNIVGLEEQLILPEFPDTPQGQKDFIRNIKTITKEVKGSIGFCYWGAELIAWKGENALDGSPWENQSLFDFDNKELPVLSEF